MRAGAIAPPSAGAYFGAWVYPSPEPTPLPTGLYEQETESLESAIGRPLRLHLHYFGFSTVFPDANNTDGLADDYTHGRIPVVSWGCSGTTLAKIAAGDSAAKAIIDNEASAIAAYGHPVFIRWFWEMNINDTINNNNQWTNPTANGNTCMATSESGKTIQQVQTDNATNFIAAWKYIYGEFANVKNVTWLWNPDYTPTWYAPSNFYPGDSYVDWVGDDEYDKCSNNGNLCSTGNGFTATINPFYSNAPTTKPLMVGETGSCQQYGAPYSQSQYFTDATNDIAPGSQQVFPNIGAFMYFDAAGQFLNGQCSWVIAPGSATQSFSAMGLNPYFGGITHGTILSKAAYSSSVTLQPSSPYPAGDVLLAYLSVHEGQSPGITVTPPSSSWKLLGRYDDYGNAAELVYELVTTSTNEQSSYTWSWGTAGGYGAMLVPYTGVNVSNPIDVSAGPTGSSGQVSSETTQSLSPTNGGEYEISFFSGYNPPQPNTGFTYAPSNWTNAASLSGQRANIVYLEYPLGLQNGQFSTTINWTGTQGAFTTAWFNAALNPAF
ncbi:MAG TPA: glycosyl hydrolase [Candidatus Baltobacteraceae bacterium]|nr:glycosyl hydrolase [Candidatus Baltobacteraceae bacterium]